MTAGLHGLPVVLGCKIRKIPEHPAVRAVWICAYFSMNTRIKLYAILEMDANLHKKTTQQKAVCGVVFAAGVIGCYSRLETKISMPMKIRMAPPKMPALPASLVPAFLPMCRPIKQMKKVTTPMSRAASRASSAL